jgi:hypothetical protein
MVKHDICHTFKPSAPLDSFLMDNNHVLFRHQLLRSIEDLLLA